MGKARTGSAEEAFTDLEHGELPAFRRSRDESIDAPSGLSRVVMTILRVFAWVLPFVGTLSGIVPRRHAFGAGDPFDPQRRTTLRSGRVDCG
jgi:hypothetical protein